MCSVTTALLPCYELCLQINIMLSVKFKQTKRHLSLMTVNMHLLNIATYI